MSHEYSKQIILHNLNSTVGYAADPLLLTGSVMNEIDYLAKIKQMQSSNQSFLHLQIVKSIMANMFGNFELGAQLALERRDDYEKKNGSPLVMLDFLHQGIALYAMARKTKAKKYFKRAKQITSTILSWAKKVSLKAYILL